MREVECERCGGMVNAAGCLQEKCPVGNAEHKTEVTSWQAKETAKAKKATAPAP